MKYINKFNKTGDFENAKSWLNELEHYVVYDAEENKVHSKSAVVPKQPKTMTFRYYEPPMSDGAELPIISRKDLFKSIKYNGRELLTEPTVDPIDFSKVDNPGIPNLLAEPSTIGPSQFFMERFSYLFGLLSNAQESTFNKDYIITYQDILGLEQPIEEGTEVQLEVEFKDNITSLSLLNIFSIGLVDVSTNIFEDCTNVTDFAGVFFTVEDEMGLSKFSATCPIDKDGTPIYNRSGNGKEGYAKVTIPDECFINKTSMVDYNDIPTKWGGGKIDDGYGTVTINVTEEGVIFVREFGFDIRIHGYLVKIDNTVYTNAVNGEEPRLAPSSDLDNANLAVGEHTITFWTSPYFERYDNLINKTYYSSVDFTNIRTLSDVFYICGFIKNESELLLLDNFKISFANCPNLKYIYCTELFKAWCLEHQDEIQLPQSLREGGDGEWRTCEMPA